MDMNTTSIDILTYCKMSQQRKEKEFFFSVRIKAMDYQQHILIIQVQIIGGFLIFANFDKLVAQGDMHRRGFLI